MTADLDHQLATALFDSEDSARLQEHPEALEGYLHRARELRRHMRVLGMDVAPVAPLRPIGRAKIAELILAWSREARALVGDGVAIVPTVAAAGDLADAILGLISGDAEWSRPSGQPSLPVRACKTCAHRESFDRCGATGFYCTIERGSGCGPTGILWAPKPVRNGVIPRFIRWLIG